jgi:hypothetical protein
MQADAPTIASPCPGTRTAPPRAQMEWPSRRIRIGELAVVVLFALAGFFLRIAAGLLLPDPSTATPKGRTLSPSAPIAASPPAAPYPARS